MGVRFQTCALGGWLWFVLLSMLVLTAQASPSALDYAHIKPLLDRRCVVCHACYDAPCQLKLTSMEGLQRGSSKQPVYDGRRLIEDDPTRLGLDAQTTQQWREKGFFSVLGSKEDAKEEASVSLMRAMLELKRSAPPPESALLSDAYDLGGKRDSVCPAPDEFSEFAEAHPEAGMPYGLPPLKPATFARLKDWLDVGAPGHDRRVLTDTENRDVQRWEAFLNQSALRAQLMSRYLFEHLYPAHLFFSDLSPVSPQPFFQLVRSATPPGEPIQVIATRRPFDDPGVARVYYRLRLVKESVVEKTHMPYALNAERMRRWSGWFLEGQPALDTLPSYEPEVAANPFLAFRDLPVKSRYQFLLEEAQYTVMAFIKGPVCRGQVALSVINDHFWVFFLDPAKMSDENNTRFLSENFQNLQLPASDESTVSPFRWLKYVEREYAFLKSKSRFIQDAVAERLPVNLDLLWDGQSLLSGDSTVNPNAALTVFRHDDTATVVQGLWGQRPQTAWLINYDLLERIHYLLVAGFDVFGNVGHQLSSRIYMDFLRMESELQFLALLPKTHRQMVHKHWYRGSVETVKKFLFKYGANFDVESDVTYTTDRPLKELYQMLSDRYVGLPPTDLGLNDVPVSIQTELKQLDRLQGVATAWLPEVSVLHVRMKQGPDQYFSLLHHTAWANISYLFEDDDRRLPQEDGVSLLRGVVGAFPNAFFSLHQADLQPFLVQVAGLRSEQDYLKLKARYGVRRTDRRFWDFADRLHDQHLKAQPLSAGLLDFSRLENR